MLSLTQIPLERTRHRGIWDHSYVQNIRELAAKSCHWCPVSDLPSTTTLPVVADKVVDADALLDEYHALVDLELAGRMTEEEMVHLRDIETQLNLMDEHDPMEQAMDDRLRQTGDKLDATLEQMQQARRPSSA